MKQLSVLLCLLACTYFFTSCKKDASSLLENRSATLESKSAAANSTKSKAVPFKGEYATTVQVLSGPPMLRQRITGTGHATHLGRSSFVALSTVNLTTAPPFGVSGTAIFYAANGDEFYTTFTGTSTPIGGGRSNVVVNHTITGGTGRFEDASGSFTGITVANPAMPTGSITYEGYISY